MNNLNNVYKTHNMLDVFCDSFKIKGLILFCVLFVIGVFISKKTSKKIVKVNNSIYLLLCVLYLVVSIIKAYILSKLPPHDFEKDFCGLEYTTIQIIINYHIPIIYTIIVLAMLGDKKIRDKKKG